MFSHSLDSAKDMVWEFARTQAFEMIQGEMIQEKERSRPTLDPKSFWA